MALGMKFRPHLVHRSTHLKENRQMKQDLLERERDVPVPTRDGNNIYCVTFRPRGTKEKLASISCGTRYGKRNSTAKNMLHRMGIESSHISEHVWFEAIDPTMFCLRGYAINNTPGW